MKPYLDQRSDATPPAWAVRLFLVFNLATAAAAIAHWIATN
jgi:hypothetical protein